MKSIRQWKKEKGDIALIAVFATLVFLVLMAFVIDGGLLYYRSAKLQNAVDAAVVGVAQHMDSEDKTKDYWAKYYLKENGFDKEEYGDKMEITIEEKGALDDEYAEDNEDAYVSDLYIKLNVKITTSGIFGAMSGYQNISGDKGGLNKTGYAKVAANYVQMPQALHYTIFGGNTTTTTQYKNMTVQINGRADGNLTTVVNAFTNAINGINSHIIQPIIEFFGGTGNYNDLISPSLSTAITNGDVHSNADINIGVQALNASRTKDGIYNGDNAECSCISVCISSDIDTTCPVCADNYTDCEGDSFTYDDYNQVTYTAVGNIYFSNAKLANSSFISRIFGAENDRNSHVYVQNQQYLEQTQCALNIINTMNFDGISSTGALQAAYQTAAQKYLAGQHRVSDEQKDAIIAQKNNLQYNANGTYSLFNQRMIVYDVTNNTANRVMMDIEDGTTISDLLQEVVDAGIDATHTMEPHVTLNSVNHYDSASSSTSYNIVFTKKYNSSTATLTVAEAQITNRNVKNMTNVPAETTAGYRFAVARTFQELSSYIDIPNMKPYFIRQINRSVKNATTNKDSSGDSSVESATSIKKAVKNEQTKLENYISTKDTLAAKKGTVVSEEEKASGKYSADNQQAYYDGKYASDTALTSQDTSPLFRYNLRQKTVGGNNDANANNLILTEYGSNDAGHTTFRGEELYKNGVLKTPEQFITDYNNNNANKYGANAVTAFYNSTINGNYGPSRIASAREYINANKSYAAFTNSIAEKTFAQAAPAENEVFLTEGIDITTLNSQPGHILNDKLNTDHTGWPGASVSGNNSQEVTLTLPDVSGKGNASDANCSEPNMNFTTTVSAGSRSYNMKNLIFPTNTAGNVATNYRSDTPFLRPSNYSWSGTRNVTSESEDHYRFNLQNGYVYNRVNQITKSIYKMGFYVTPNSRVRINGVYLANQSKQGTRGTEFGENSVTFIENDGYPNTNDTYHQEDGVRYLYYNADNAAWMNIYEGAQLYIKGHAKLKGDLNMDANSLLYVDGNLKIYDGKTINLKAGAKLIVNGTLDASSIRAVDGDNTSIICCNELTNGNTSGVLCANLYVTGNADIQGITINANSTVVIGGNFNPNGRGMGIGSGAKVVCGSIQSGNTLPTPGGYSLCTGSSLDYSSTAITVNSGHLLAAGSLTLNSTTVNGELYASSALNINDTSKTLTVGSSGRVYAGSILANVSNAGQLSTTSMGGASLDRSLTNSGTLKVGANAMCSSISNSGSMLIGGNITTGSTLTNSNKLKAVRMTIGTKLTNNSGAVLQATNAISTGTDMDNNGGSIKCASTITVTGTINNTTTASIIQSTGAITAAYINNKGQIRTGAAIDVSGNISCDSGSYMIAKSVSATTFYQNGVLYIDDGDLTTRTPADGETGTDIGLLMISGSIYVVHGNVNVGGNITGYASGVLFCGGNITVVGSITFTGGVIKTEGDLTASDITADGTLMQFGSISVASVWRIDAGTNAYVTGDMSAYKIENRGTIYLKRSNMNVKTVYNYSTGVIICDGNMNVLSCIDMEKRESIYNEGEMYINGNLSAEHRIHTKNGKLYVRGDLTACNNALYLAIGDLATGKKTFHFEGNSQIYVSGWLNSAGATKGVYITGSGNGVLSIYGRGHKTCFGTNICYFDNDQVGSRVYLGTGSGWEVIQEHRQVTLTGQFDNDGQLFVYGNMTVSETLNLGGNTASFTKVCGDLTETSHSIKVNSGHTLVAFNNIACTKVEVYSSSKVYGMNALNATTQTYVIAYNGLVYCGPSTTVNSGTSQINITSNGDFAGQMYYPGSGKGVKLNVPTTFNGGVLVTEANISFANASNITLTGNARVYIGGTSNLGANAFINTLGEMYLMQDVSINDFLLLQFNAGCTNYLAPMIINGGTRGVISSGQCIDWNGTNYFDNSFIENCTDAVNKNVWGTVTGPAGGEIIDDPVVKNRYVAIRINGGATHFSGDLTVTNGGLATRVATGGVLSCNSFNTYCCIYNQGEFVICNNLNYDCESKGYYSDKGDNNWDQGYCIRNGTSNSDINAMMYVGGSNPVSIRGAFETYGKFYCRSNMTVRGYTVPEQYQFYYRTLVGQVNNTDHSTTRHEGKQKDYAPHFSIKTGRYSKSHFAGSVTTHASVWTGERSEFSVQTNLGYGQAILNGGIFYVKGSVAYSSDPYAVNNIQIIWTTTEISEDIKGMVSIANGFIENSSVGNNDAVFYCGSSLQTGTAKDSSDDKKAGGAVQNWGSMYINGDLNSYSCTTANKMGINMVGICGHANSKTFIRGNAYSGGGFVTMINSIFMCGGDLESKRCARIGSPEVLSGDDDIDSSSYCYVGRDMMTSTNGTVGNGDIGVPNSTWNYFIAFSNANIYVGNAFFTNSITVPKRNTTFAVDGKYNGNGQTYRGIISNIQATLIDLAFRAQGSNVDDIKFTVIGDSSKSAFEENSNKAQFYHIIVRGSAYFREPVRFRDMCQVYIYGDFLNYSDNTSRNVEIGKSISFDSGDDTWAAQDAFKTSRDLARNDPNFDYNYEHAGYFFVQGSFKTRGRLSIYAGTTLKVGGDCYVRHRVQLSHDGNLYVGGNLNVPGSANVINLLSGTGYIDAEEYSDVMVRGDIVAGNYIVMREHSLLFCGKKVRAMTSFEAKTASRVMVCGSLEATLNTIKIRDESQVFVGGNMTALRYIELGKFDDAYTTSTRGDIKRTDDEEIGASCICETRCTEANADCPVCAEHPGDCEAEARCSCTSECHDQSVGNSTSCPVCKTDYHNCMKPDAVATNELGDEATDKANGGMFYIGKALSSYTGYIREYGFSSVSVGSYVFALDYITLRSNADMWVLPEMYNNNTYKHVAYVSESDGSIIGNIVDKIKEAAYNVKDTLSFKNGSVYSMGELTLNKNASMMGTCDCFAYDQTLLSHDALLYFGRDFNCYAASLQLDFSSKTPLVGFASEGKTYTTLTCPNNNTKRHGKNYTMYCSNYNSGHAYKCDRCNATIPTSKVRHNITCPVTIYANRDINVYTTIDMKLTYMLASQGNVNLYDVYSNTDNIEGNIKQLPNAVGSFAGDINYFAMYGKICALFYAPQGTVDLDGYYQEIWGSCIGDKVYDNTYYLNMHRFTNWRTMDLQIAESGTVYLISKSEYDAAEDNVDDDYLYTYNSKDESEGGASLFFPGDFLESMGYSTGAESGNSNAGLGG